MNCLIIEDEKVAAERLAGLIRGYDGSSTILATLQSVAKSVEWFSNNPPPDLVFMDIQLADGLSFEIFEQTNVASPVIFTTAYGEYALKAFKVNSIDYLLKPIDSEELGAAIDKFRAKNQPLPANKNHVFDSILQTLAHNFKSKFVIKVGEHIKVILVDKVQCFYSMEKSTFLQNTQGRSYAINYSLDQVEGLIDPKIFYRINRKTIIAFSAIKDIIAYSNSRLQVKLYSENNGEELIVSRERAQKFKVWLES